MASVNPLDVAAAQGTIGLHLLVEEVDKLVSLPDIYYRLEELIVDPNSTTDSIADLLRSDPDLCARMLRMANSAFYSFPTRIESIERAVSTIGLRQIRELVLVTAVIQAFEGIPSAKVNMASFWEHSVAVAIMSREIGQSAGIPGAQHYYIPGLLHDLGRLVMYLKLPGLMIELLEKRDTSGIAMDQLEHEILSYSHADIGGCLLEFWKLPQSIWEPVAMHHKPANSGEFMLTACAIHIADAWVNANHSGSSGSRFDLEIDPEALELVGVDMEAVENAARVAAEQTQAVVRQFMGH
ncbi:MAG: HDOD domain-containing protein [Gammaproteobacteria bacterium]|nr:HDOD domain-containing protein [Gammaproteobacteria bacterium]